MQAMFEEAFFALANALYEKDEESSFLPRRRLRVQQRGNGLVFDRSPYKDLYIRPRRATPAAPSARPTGFGTRSSQHQVLVMTHAYWGPE